MFSHFKSNNSNSIQAGIRYYNYSIIDTCFTERIKVKNGYYDNYEFALAVIKTYRRRNLNVIANLAAYYFHLNDNGISPIIDLITDNHPRYIDYVDKSIHYKTRYMPILKIRLSHILPKKKMKVYSLEDLITGNGIIINTNVH